MSSWREIEGAEPGFAACAKSIFDSHVHKTIATLRADGSPRISSSEIIFAEGEVFIGSMPGSRKSQDIKRDSRIAIHSGSDDPPDWKADAKLSGLAIEVTDPEDKRKILSDKPELDEEAIEAALLYKIDIHEMSIVGLNEEGSGLVIDYWSQDKGLRQMERS